MESDTEKVVACAKYVLIRGADLKLQQKTWATGLPVPDVALTLLNKGRNFAISESFLFFKIFY